MTMRICNPSDFIASQINTPPDEEIAKHNEGRSRFDGLHTVYSRLCDQIAVAHKARNRSWTIPEAVKEFDADLPDLQFQGGKTSSKRFEAKSYLLEHSLIPLLQRQLMSLEKNDLGGVARELSVTQSRLLGGSSMSLLTDNLITSLKLSRVYASAFMPVTIVTKCLILVINESDLEPKTKAALVDTVQVLGLVVSSWLHERAQVAAGHTVSMYTRSKDNGLLADILTEDAPWFMFTAAKMIMTTINARIERSAPTSLHAGLLDVAITPFVMWLVAGIGTPLAQQLFRSRLTNRDSAKSVPKLPDSWACGNYLKLLLGGKVRTPDGEDVSVFLNATKGSHLYRHRGIFSAISKAILLCAWYTCHRTWVPFVSSQPSGDKLISDSIAKVFNSTGDKPDVSAIFNNTMLHEKLEQFLPPDLLNDLLQQLNQTALPSQGSFVTALNSESKFNRGMLSDVLFISFFAAHEHVARLLRHVFGSNPPAKVQSAPVDPPVEIRSNQIVREIRFKPEFEPLSNVNRELGHLAPEISPKIGGDLINEPYEP